MGIKSWVKNSISKVSVRGSFVQNVAFSLSGNAFVLGIGFLLTPIIARIYGPAAYGQFAVFAAIASLIQPLSTFQLQAGYVAAKNDEEFSSLIKISFLTLVATTLLVLLGSLIYMTIGPVPHFSEQLALFLPVYIFFAGLFSILRGWNIKLEEFKRSAQAKVIATLTGKSTTLGFGILITQSAMGMIYGSLASFIIESVGYVSKKMSQSIKLVLSTDLTIKFHKQTLQNFSSYPKFVTTNSIIISLSNQLPIYFIAAWYSTEKIGLFSLSLSLVIIPINLIAVSIGSVFLPKISSIIEDIELRNKTIVSLYKKLFYPGLLALLFLAFVLEFILPLILGSRWQGAGQLSAIISSSFALAIVALPLSNTYRLINFEKANLALTITFLILKVLAMLLAATYGDFKTTVASYLMINLLHHGFQILVLFNKLKINFNFVIRDIIVLTIIYLLLYKIIWF